MSWNEACSSSYRPSALEKPESIYDFGYPRPENEACSSPFRPSTLNKPESIYDFGYRRPQNIACSSPFRPSALNKPESIYDFGYPRPQNEACFSPLNKPESIYDFGYPRPQNECASPVAYNMVSKAGSFSYSRFRNDNNSSFKDLEIGWDQGDFENKDNRPYMIRWKSGKTVDQRLLMVLESFFQEIYVKREDFFKKIFPGMYDEFVDVFNKIGAMLWKNNDRVKNRALRRSLSFGSPRRNEWFSVRTPNVVVGNPDGQGGQTDQAGAGSEKPR